ncbi:MAG: xanthine phosphoribosyltransferase [Alphaproteobacteria bacterium]|nr:xanthine phosphoribosyltransferase [Alphaproteobacteria bacterium]
MSENRYSRDFPVSWEEIHRDSKALAWRLLEAGPWEGIVAITRGGLVPACVMARELDIRTVDTLCILTYDHMTQGEAQIVKAPDLTDGGKGWMVIDDLVDTGATLKIARELYPNAHFACVYAKPAGAPLVDTFITEVSQDTWIHFPWDLSIQYAEPIASARRK